MGRKRYRRQVEQAAVAAARERRTARNRWIDRLIFAGFPLILLAAGWLAWTAIERSSEFEALVERGQPALAAVRQEASQGRTHVPDGTPVATDEDYPLSGTHWPTWIDPGFYEEPQPKGRLIHSLEHGMVVVYYGALDAAAQRQLRSWSRRFDGDWSGLVVVPHPRLGSQSALVVTAWQHRLDLDTFDRAAIAAFLDEYRGKGPENPVR